MIFKTKIQNHQKIQNKNLYVVRSSTSVRGTCRMMVLALLAARLLLLSEAD
jgi:hypothetical protein